MEELRPEIAFLSEFGRDLVRALLKTLDSDASLTVYEAFVILKNCCFHDHIIYSQSRINVFLAKIGRVFRLLGFKKDVSGRYRVRIGTLRAAARVLKIENKPARRTVSRYVPLAKRF
ncbi:MAG: hypothetical protein QXT26_06410 [Thermoproteota archaeon]